MIIMQLRLLVLALFSALAAAASTSPTWSASPDFYAGQVKVANTDSGDVRPIAAPTNYSTSIQNSNAFASVPRVAFGLIGYVYAPPSSSSTAYGVRFEVTSVTTNTINYEVTPYAITFLDLDYLYLAVLPAQASFALENVYLDFSASSSLADPSAPQRYQSFEFANPESASFPLFATQTIVLVAYPFGFKQSAHSGRSAFDVEARLLNATHYAVNVSSSGNNSLTQLDFSIVACNRDQIQDGYQAFLDLSEYTVEGSTLVPSPDHSNQEFNEKYQFRSSLNCATMVDFAVGGVASVGFYYTATSATDSVVYWRLLNHRLRTCAGITPYYRLTPEQCLDACPAYHLTNSSFDFCDPCHYSCYNCTAPADPLHCSQCSPSDHRSLLNSSLCHCDSRYYDAGAALCHSCHSSCLTCSGPNSSQCLSCDSSLRLVLNSSSCECDSGYYLPYNSSACQPCATGCLACSETNSSTTCSTCDSTNNWALDSSGGCFCPSGYSQSNTSCIADQVICGDGVVGTGEECDDSNAEGGDGCSGACLVEADHTCISNHSAVSHSLCYYSGAVTMAPTLVYKVPGSNSVEMELAVSAPNCNPSTLKAYLEQSTQLVLYDQSAARLLQATWTNVAARSIAYDPSSSVLSVDFDYSATIDLSQKYLRLEPSSSTASSTLSYFYLTSAATVTLPPPYNNLDTTYYSEDQLQAVNALKSVFVALVVLFWLLVGVAGVLGRLAVGVEAMLVLQLAYLSLVSQERVLEAWSGLQLYGRHSSGYSAELVDSYALNDLLVLQLDGHVLNNFNIPLCLAAVLAAICLAFTIRTRHQPSRGKEETESEGRSHYVSSASKDPAPKEVPCLQLATTHVADCCLGLLLVGAGVWGVGIVFTDAANLVGNMASLLLVLATAALFFVCSALRSDTFPFRHLSFCTLLLSRKKQRESPCGFILRHYYLIILAALALNACILGLARSSGPAGLVPGLLGAAGAIVFHVAVDCYSEWLDRLRAVVNCSVLTTVLLLHLLSTFAHDSLSTGVPLVAAVVALLGVVVAVSGITMGVLLRRLQLRTREEEQLTMQMREMDNSLVHANITFLNNALEPQSPTPELVLQEQPPQEPPAIQDRIEQYSSLKKTLLVSIEEQMKELSAFKKEARRLGSDSSEEHRRFDVSGIGQLSFAADDTIVHQL